MQVEIDTGAEQGLDFGTGTDADVTKPCTFCADDDGLLGVTFDVYVGSNQGGPTFPRHDFFNKNSQRMGQFFTHSVEGGFSDEFGDTDVERFVGGFTVWVEQWPFRHPVDQQLDEDVELVAGGGADRDDFGPFAERGNVKQVGGEALGADEVRFGCYSDGARRDQPGGDESVAGTHLLVGGQREDDDVNFRESVPDQVVEPFPQ